VSSNSSTLPFSFISRGITCESLNRLSENTLVAHLGIEYTEVGDQFISAKMPVDRKTHQPFGLLHGGASVALAETLGSIAANCCVDGAVQYCVGLDINANHIKSVKQGFVTGTTRPLHIGKRTHVWEIRITDEGNDLICISRITMAVIDKR
jgi:1,4-dihydroxy-2-naphthoyl-CoA hydrolase